MPIISMFYGIIIRMYLIDNQSITICRTFTPSMLSSRLLSASKTARSWLVSCLASNCGLVQAWIELRHDELLADWELSLSGEQPYKITPL